MTISGGHHEELQIRRDSQRPGRASGRRDSGSGGTFQQRNFQHFWKSIFNTFGTGRYSGICQTENTGKIGGEFYKKIIDICLNDEQNRFCVPKTQLKVGLWGIKSSLWSF